MNTKSTYIITESVHGTWFYHLSLENKLTKSLCNKDTMKCELPLESWGEVGHLKERYCAICYDLAYNKSLDSDGKKAAAGQLKRYKF